MTGKRFPLNMRTTAETRQKLEAAAEHSGRSLAQEVEARLERTFTEDSLRTLIREELEADRKRQREIEARGIHPSVYDAEREAHYGGVEWTDEQRAMMRKGLVVLQRLSAVQALKSADQSKPD